MLPCDTNLEGRKVCVENHIHVGDQVREVNPSPQETQEEIELEGQEEGDQGGEIQGDEVQIRRSSRQTRPSSRLKDFVMYLIQYPIQDYISYENITYGHYIFLNALSQSKVPKVYEKARLDPKLCKAMDKELDALEKNQTWEICLLPKNKKPVVYK
jgi:hypothetical protein